MTTPASHPQEPYAPVTTKEPKVDEEASSVLSPRETAGSEKSFEDNAGPLSRFLMLYLEPLFHRGFKEGLAHADLGPASLQDSADHVNQRFEIFWKEECQRPVKNRSLWNVLWRIVGYDRVFKALALYGLYAGISYGPILILSALTRHLQGTRVLEPSILWILVALMFVLPMLASLFAAQSNNVMAHIGVQIRNALIDAIHRKSLRLSPSARQAQSTGMIVNMFSNDTAQLQRFLYFFNNCCMAPAQIIVSLALIYQQVGAATFVGLAFMVVLLPLNGAIFSLLNRMRMRKVLVTDKRVKLINEILGGIRILKYYSWEMPFLEKVSMIRDRELALLKHIAYVIAIGFTLIMFSAPLVQPILIFFTYVKLGNQLDAATAFTTLALFNLLQLPFAFLPMGLAQYSQSLVSTRRMQTFFESEELDDYIHTDEAADGTVISFTGVSMCWQREEDAKAAALKVQEEVENKNKADKDKKNRGKVEMTVERAPANKIKIDDGEHDEDNKSQLINRSCHTLINLDLSIRRGELVAVIGTVGSGKSSLLNGLLGEMILQSGIVRVSGSIAYCDQRPWILNQTLRDNILFNKPFDEIKFNAAISAAALNDDIAALPDGVLTEIGERGINLSGGQKARGKLDVSMKVKNPLTLHSHFKSHSNTRFSHSTLVALARAVYRDADVYLLDDSLSAVDAFVGAHLFNHCIKGALAGKTRILVTHHVHLLSQCDKVVILHDGSILLSGTYDEIMASHIDISQYVKKVEASGKHEVERETGKDNIEANNSSIKTSILLEDTQQRDKQVAGGEGSVTDIVTIPTSSDDAKSKTIDESEEVDPASTPPSVSSTSKSPKKLMTIEERNLGDVALSTYVYYIGAGGWHWFFGLIFFSIVGQVIALVASFYLAYWGLVTTRSNSEGAPLSTAQNLFYLDTFALISMMSIVSYAIRSLLLAEHRLGTSTLLHKDLLKSIMGATVAFFDVTPLGRVLNRLSSDMLTVDEELQQTINSLMNSIFQCVGAVGAIVGATKGTFLVLFVPITFVYFRVQSFFRKTNTTVARLESISRSPIYTDFSQALTGVSSIRAYDEAKHFIHHLEKQLDNNSIAAITQQLASQWLAIRLDFLGSIITLFISIIAVSSKSFIPPGFLALGLTYSFQLTQFLKMAVRFIAQGEAQLNSVERIKHYIDNIEQEVTPDPLPPSFIPPNWPTEGKIMVNNIQLKYRNGPLVLKGIDCSIGAREKVGIAGRTGSGKSSLMVALFRIQELSGGSIFIDDIDISKVPLPLLRSKLGIIPQDSTLFSSSLRFNLDPFENHTDDALWDVLEKVCLKDHISSLPSKLHEEVAEGGDNFSSGQRQLICIARALLRNPRILVLDEATASIDNATDLVIQETVRSSFKSSTLLTIAHRLHTIIDSDRIMVLDDGYLGEFGTPSELLAKEGGMFKGLWDRHKASHSND